MPKINKINIKIPTMPLDKCIGKTDPDGFPGMSVEEHCRIVGHVAKVFRKLLSPLIRKLLIPNIASLCSIHDIGKVSPGFMKQIYRELLKLYAPDLAVIPDSIFMDGERFIPHSIISEASFKDVYKGMAPDEMINILGSILGGHHGFRTTSGFGSEIGAYGGPEWEKLRRELITRLTTEFGDIIFRKLNTEIANVNAGYLSICDWIGSDEKNFPGAGNIGDLHKRALQAIHSLGWKKSVIKPGLSFKTIFDGKTPTEMQEKFIKSVTIPGVYILESGMGSGKTEPALYAAYKLICKGYHDGIFFALPTRLTSNRMYERIEKFLTNAYEKGMAPKLIHGMSAIEPIGNGELSPGGAWFTPNRRALMLPFGVGTLDQLLLSVLRSRYNFVRTFGLVGKVIIIDEVHSYDVYTGTLLDILIKKLRRLGCTVIMLSATLTQKRKAEFLDCDSNKLASNEYPLITTRKQGKFRIKGCGSPTPQEYVVRKMTSSPLHLIPSVVKRVLSGQQAIWISNTVDKSVALYKATKDKLPGYDVGLIHSRFPPCIRRILEEKWMTKLCKGGDRSQGSLLIGTQVLEQSIDIDGDFMLSDLAPSDFLMQRMGRLWRHLIHNKLRKKIGCKHAEFWINCPNLHNISTATELRKMLGLNGLIYDPYVLWRSFRIWRRRGKISIPKDIRSVIEKTYRDFIKGQDPVWLEDLWLDLIGRRVSMRDYAKANTGSHVIMSEDDDLYPLDVTEDSSDGLFTRIISVPQVALILLKSSKDCGDHVQVEYPNGQISNIPKDKKNFESGKLTLDWTVRVPKTKPLKNVEKPKWLEKSQFGLVIPAYLVPITGQVYEVRLEDGTGTGYFFENDCGVYKPKELE